jgi:NO-binding membrane sensor protein with MHYT domain
MGLAYRRAPATTLNAFVATAKILYLGMTPRNIIKGFLWSVAITSMHYSGIFGLDIPHGKVVLNPWIVLASALISWLVCTIGCICMAEMEAMLSQQLLFSVVATTGVGQFPFYPLPNRALADFKSGNALHWYESSYLLVHIAAIRS